MNVILLFGSKTSTFYSLKFPIFRNSRFRFIGINFARFSKVVFLEINSVFPPPKGVFSSLPIIHTEKLLKYNDIYQTVAKKNNKNEKPPFNRLFLGLFTELQ